MELTVTRLTANRFLVIYSGVLTVVFVVTVFSGFSKQPTNLKLRQLTVERINVVEPDGRPRMIISDQHDFPGLIIKGHEYPHPRPAAGILFYNNEGSENGGLIFGGYKGKDGKPVSFGHLSFDKYMQDQTLVLEASQRNGHYYKCLSIVDEPDYPITDEVPLGREISAHPSERNELLRKFFKTHARPEKRLYLGEGSKKSVALVLKDKQGRKRLVLRVKANGSPVLKFFSAKGKILDQIPSPNTKSH